ncbi:MAG TPA: DUF4919 domain-containing protein [Alphaproteobacteria bacterium]
MYGLSGWRAVAVAGLVALSGCTAPPPPGSSAPFDAATDASPAGAYAGLLAAAKASPHDADFTRLRMAFTRTPAYASHGQTDRDFAALFEAGGAGDWQKAQALAEAQVERNYVRLKAHRYAAAVAHQRGDKAAEEHHLTFYRGLLSSITGSGDGKSPDTPMSVISVDEEYEVLWTRRQRSGGQSLLQHNGKMLDVLAAVPETGSAATRTEDVYFDVSALFEWAGQRGPQRPSK